MHRWVTLLADIYQCLVSVRGKGHVGTYAPATILEFIFLSQHWRLGTEHLASLAAKALLMASSLRQYTQWSVLRRLGVYGLAVLFLQQLTRSANYLRHGGTMLQNSVESTVTRIKNGDINTVPALLNDAVPTAAQSFTPIVTEDEPTAVATLLSSLCTLYVNAQRRNCGDLTLTAQLFRVLAGLIRMRSSLYRRQTLLSTCTTLVDCCIAFQIVNMQRVDLPQMLLWPESLSDMFTSVGTLSRCSNVRSGRLTYVRLVSNPEQSAFVMSRHRSGIFSRPDRHLYFQALRQLQHANVHRHQHFIEDWRVQYFVLEYVTHIPLIHFIDTFKRIPEGVGHQLLHQMLLALTYIHDQAVTHRDVKLENILVNARAPQVWRKENKNVANDDRIGGLCATLWPEGSVLLTNFDKMATHIAMDGLQTGSQIGTAHYAAPEIQKKKYNSQVDVWSLGVSVFVLLCGEFPFDADPSIRSGAEIVRVVCRKRRVKWPVGSTVSPQAKDCVESMLNPDPLTRPKAREVLLHEWFSEPTRISGGLRVDEYASVIAVSAHSPTLVSLRKNKKLGNVRSPRAASRPRQQTTEVADIQEDE